MESLPAMLFTHLLRTFTVVLTKEKLGGYKNIDCDYLFWKNRIISRILNSIILNHENLSSESYCSYCKLAWPCFTTIHLILKFILTCIIHLFIYYV
jgi:hypothetical protein